MPTDFPDMKSLKRNAELWKFRPPNKGESEADYRTALADFVEPRDFVESCEIRNKVGWNRVIIKDVTGSALVKLACGWANGKVFITSESGWKLIKTGQSDLFLIGFDEADVFEFDPKYAARPEWGKMRQWKPRA